MDNEMREKIKQLSIIAYEKGEWCRRIGMSNAPSDPVAKRQLLIDYAVARSEMIDANLALEDALNEYKILKIG